MMPGTSGWCRTLLAIGLLGAAVSAAHAQSLTNGGFESATDFESWTIDEAYIGSLLVCDTRAATAHSGQRSAHFGAHEGQPDVLSKHIATTPGLTYRVSFWLSSDNVAPIYDGFLVTWGDQVLLDLGHPQSGFPYTLYTFNVAATSQSTEIAFLGYKRFGTFRLDDVDVRLAPGADTCSLGPLIFTNQTYTGDNLTATNDHNPSCGQGGGQDVWYRFVPTCDSTLQLDTCGSSFDTTLSVWTGTCGALTEFECNDDNLGAGPCPGGTTSYKTLQVTAGATYYIRIAGYGSSYRGNYVLRLTSSAPGNDACSNPAPVLADSTINGDMTCATTDAATSCAQTTADVWYSYTPPCSQTLHLDTCGTTDGVDTVLSLYTGNCGALTEVACNDDAFQSCPSIRSSSLETPVSAGVRYLIRVASYGPSGAGGPFVLNVRAVESAHDTCATALQLAEGANSFNGQCAQQPTGIYCQDSFRTSATWFKYTATCTGSVTVDFCDTGSASNALLSAFSGTCENLICEAAEVVAISPDCPAGAPVLRFNAQIGATYWLCYTQYLGDPHGSGTLTLHIRPTNDACGDATPVGDGTYSGNTACATPDGVSSCGASNFAGDVWYQWTATCDGVLYADLCGSSYDTVLTVFRGTCDNMQELACNDDSNFCTALGLSYVSVPVVADETYLIRIAGFLGRAGAYELTLTSTRTDNLTCAAALPMPGGAVHVNGACADGTGGRFCDTQIDGPGLWYTYTPTCAGLKMLDFCRTGGPPRGLFSVYTGTCAGLTCVASRNVSSLPQYCPSGVKALTFDAAVGTTYYICYSQFAGTPLGAGELSILDMPPGNDECVTAAALTAGENIGNSSCATPTIDGICFPSARDVWYSYVPPSDGRLVLHTCGTSFNTNLSVYGGNCGNLALVACDDDGSASAYCTDTSASLIAIDVLAGSPYRIRLGAADGNGGPYVLNASLVAANDACEAATPVSSGATLTGNLQIATNDGTATCSPSSNDRDVWYRWTASSCSNRLLLDTCGSAIDTTLAVFGGSCGALSQIACSNDAGASGPCPASGSAAALSVPVTPSGEYWIRVGGANGAAGAFVLHVSEGPANATCAAALRVAYGVTTFDGACGTADFSGAAAPCGAPNLSAVWFQYVAECTGTASVDLCGSGYDTIATVFSGNCGALTSVACNDNGPAGQCPGGPQNAYVEFPAQSGQSYLIRISSSGGAAGPGQMDIRCTGACVNRPADMNCDCRVNNFDIDPFLLAILDPIAYQQAYPNCPLQNGDANGDGRVNNFDIDPFAVCILLFGCP